MSIWLGIIAMLVALATGFIGGSEVAAVVVCPPGKYLNVERNQCQDCPGGTYGAKRGLTDSACSGTCYEGYFCPPGSQSPMERPCGSPRVFCPPGSDAPIDVAPGHYTTITNRADGEGLDEAASKASRAQVAQMVCERGFYCFYGIRRRCPAGTFGRTRRLRTKECTGPCPIGSYCPLNTSEPILCPAGTYGAIEGLTSKDCSGPCPIGHYCEAGTGTFPIPCPPGKFGNSTGLQTRACSHSYFGSISLTADCPKGYFCPLGTTLPFECGGVDKFCPSGSSAPTNAKDGFYTISTDGFSPSDYVSPNGNLFPVDAHKRVAQILCEPGYYCKNGVKKPCEEGYYGDTPGLSTSTCSGICPAGYYCPTGSRSYELNPCSSVDVFCPAGSPQPISVETGYYSDTGPSHRREEQKICTFGTFCVNGVQHLCPSGTYGNALGLSTPECSGRCSAGYACPTGSILPTQITCSAGFYSANGKGCLPCAPGYFCAAGSPSRRQNRCGADHLYCPLGSGTPLMVRSGFYSHGGDDGTRIGESPCKVNGSVHVANCPTTTQGVSLYNT